MVQLNGGVLRDLCGHLVLARILVTWGVLSSATMFVNGAFSFYILRFLLGAAEAGFFPGMILYLTYWFPIEARGRAVGAGLVVLRRLHPERRD